MPRSRCEIRPRVPRRDTTTNGEGYYTFASVPVSTYELTVEAPNFRQYKATDIGLGGGEQRKVNVQLQVGAAGETVQVNAENLSLAVTDSGEKSFALETEQLENFTQVGSNAAEYIKIVPGFGISEWHPEQIELQRPDYRDQCQRRFRQPEPFECRLLVITGFQQILWTSRPTARTSPTLAVTAIRRSIQTRISCRNSRC